MKRCHTPAVAAGLVILVSGGTLIATGQLPLGPTRNSGQTITPVYEGWYANPDGTINLSWGYFNRNTKEELDIQVGASNRMSPGGTRPWSTDAFLAGTTSRRVRRHRSSGLR